MKLIDHSTRAKQIRHTLKHYFGLPERYWDLCEDFMTWRTRWQILQGADALDPERPERVEQNDQARTAVNSGYGHWLVCAQRAVAEAEQQCQIYRLDEPGKSIYVGRSGVVAIAAMGQRTLSLVTSFRCVPHWTVRHRDGTGIAQSWEEAAHGWTAAKILGVSRRTAVRRAARRALGMQASSPAASGSGSCA